MTAPLVPRGPRLLCSTATIFAKPLHEAFAILAEAGFDGVEVMVTKDPSTQDAHLLRELAEGNGLSVDVVHAPFLLMTRAVWGTDPIGKIYRAIELAQDVGTALVVVHPPYRWQQGYRRWLQDQLPGLERNTGIRVAMENMFPLRVRGRKVATFHADQSLEDLGDFPDVVLDTSHAAVAGLDLFEALERLGDRLVHVHLSNNAGKGWDSHLRVDEGILPLDGFLDALAERAFEGTVSLELDLRRYLDDETALHDVLMANREFCESRLALRA